MNDLYHLALFVHIGGVLLLFVAIGAEALAVWGIGRAQTLGEVRLWLRSARGPEKLFPLGGALILIAGLYMAITVWQGTPWVVVGLIGLISFSIAGAMVNGGRFKALEKAMGAAGDGAISDELRRQRANPTLRVSLWTMSVAALGIVYMMVTKPDWVGSIAALVIALLIGAVAGLLTGQRGGAVAPAQAGEDRAATS